VYISAEEVKGKGRPGEEEQKVQLGNSGTQVKVQKGENRLEGAPLYHSTEGLLGKKGWKEGLGIHGGYYEQESPKQGQEMTPRNHSTIKGAHS